MEELAEGTLVRFQRGVGPGLYRLQFYVVNDRGFRSPVLTHEPPRLDGECTSSVFTELCPSAAEHITRLGLESLTHWVWPVLPEWMVPETEENVRA